MIDDVGAVGTGLAWGWSLAGGDEWGRRVVITAVVLSVAVAATVAAVAGTVPAGAFTCASAGAGVVHAAWRRRLLARFGPSPAAGQVQ